MKLDLPLVFWRSVIVPIRVPFSHGFSMAGTSDRLNFSEAGLIGIENQTGGDRAECEEIEGVGKWPSSA